MGIGIGNTVKIIITGDVKDVQKKLSQAEKDMTKFEKVVGKSFLRVRKTVKSILGPFEKLGYAITAAFAVRAITRFIGEATRMAAEARVIQSGFENLTASIGSTADVMLTKLREATRGTISDMELMRQTNQAILLGLPLTTKEMASLAETAMALGKAVGRDATSALRDLVTGLGRQSTMVLDNLGITIRLNEAYANFAKRINKTANSLTAAEKRVAFYTEALNRAREAADKLHDANKTELDDLQQLRAEWENWRTEKGNIPLKIFGWIKKEYDYSKRVKAAAREGLITELQLMQSSREELMAMLGVLDAAKKAFSSMSDDSPNGPLSSKFYLEKIKSEEKLNALDKLKAENKTELLALLRELEGQYRSTGKIQLADYDKLLTYTSTHREDLEMILNALELIKKNSLMSGDPLNDTLSANYFAQVEHAKTLDAYDKIIIENKKDEQTLARELEQIYASTDKAQIAHYEKLLEYAKTHKADLASIAVIEEALADLRKTSLPETISLQKELNGIIESTDQAQLKNLQTLLEYAKAHKEFAAAVTEIETQIKAIQQKSTDAEKKRLEEQQRAWKENNRILVELSEETARDIQDSFTTFFFDAFEGKLKKLSDYLKAFATSVKQSISSVLSSMVTNRAMSGMGNMFMSMGFPNMGGAFNPRLIPTQAGALPSGFYGPPAPPGSYSTASGTFVPGGMPGGSFMNGPWPDMLAGLGTIYSGYKSAGWKGAVGSGLGYAGGYVAGGTLAAMAAPAMVSAGLTGAASTAALGLLAPGIGILVGALIGKVLSKGAKARAKRQQRHAGILNDFFNSYGDYFEQAGVGDILTGTRSATDILGNVGYGGYADDNVEKVLASFRSGGTSAYSAFTADFPSRYFKTYGSIYSQIKDQDAELYETFKTITDFFGKFPEYKQEVIDLNLQVSDAFEYVLSKEDEVVAAIQQRYETELSWIDQLKQQIAGIDQNIIDIVRATYTPEDLVGAYYGDLQSLMDQMLQATGSEDFARLSSEAQQAVNTWFNQVSGLGDTSLTEQAQTEALEFLALIREEASGQILTHEATALEQRSSMIEELHKIYGAVTDLNESFGGMDEAVNAAGESLSAAEALPVNLNISIDGHKHIPHHGGQVSSSEVVAALDRAIDAGDPIAATIKGLLVG